jgi:hypothetical protein
MDKQEITCGACGVAWSLHKDQGHSYVMRDDQQFVPKKGTPHYALKDRRVVLLAKPLAGVDWIAAVPANTRWRVDHFQAQFVTSAAAGNRVPHLVVTDGQGNRLYNVPAPANQIAAQTLQYSGATDSVSANFDNAVVLMLPQPLKLLQGWTLQMVTSGLDVADQWSNVNLLVKEWLAF